MKTINITTKVTITLLISFIAIFNMEAQELIFSDVFEYKNQIATYNSFKKLLNNPTDIESHIKQNIKNDEKILDTLFDFHAIYDIPISNLVNNLIDLGNEQNVFPRMIYTKDLNPTDPLWSPHLQEVKTQFKMGRIEETYHYVFYKVPIVNDDGSILIKWNLYDSIDGKFEYNYGSWYLKEIIENGKSYTYVRNYVHYEMKNYPGYVFIGMKLGGRKDSKNFFKALQKAAQ
ncbi:MAG: hypothetical protein KAQ93_00965 [Spirochaetales bacterium]|nr:hypothetical protein [Spirochaetales bacterium]